MAKANKQSSVNIKLSKPMLYSVAGLGGLILLFFGVWIYTYSNTAARVNGEVITKKIYEENLASEKKYQEVFQKVKLDDVKTAKMEKDVLDRLIKDKVAQQEAKKRDIIVTQEDIQTEFELRSEANSGKEEFTKFIADNYALNIEQYKEYKIKPYLTQKRLEAAVIKEDSYSKGSQNKASQALSELKNGSDFSEVVKKYSDDELSKNQAGDMGYLKRATVVKPIEDAVFSLEVNGLSDIVRTDFGYHIIKVTDKRDDEVRWSQIVISVESFQDWLTARVSEAKVKKYI